ncbi:hypothetical protein KI811_17385 [Geobacter hydrogenophilus]|uniref:Uncharacterized protein n=1 Tax=Geobacter hydrogenophilus TaxID=40983 RepID=A0A9W6G2Q2_9BACT|nr:hypothetical protein [Geobacter hydrogenophilus]MBT0895582.1 hypothetical protein [Geobacter hydrogenophilus]GLI39272.1 hypothetical protein GHYDROH2_27730 [Geobacter hydrogenophilus]
MRFNRAVAALIIGLLIMLHFRPDAHAGYLVKNRIVTNPATNGQLLPWGTGRIASYREVSAFLYRTESSGDWLYMYDGSGNESHIPLPDRFDLNDRANAEYLLTSPSDLWIWSGVLGRTMLRHYQLLKSNNSRLPDKAVRVSVTKVGDEDTRPGAMLKLSSGGVIAVWYQFEYHPDRRLDIGLVHVGPKGEIKTNYPILAPGKEGTPVATRWAMAQHPTDGSIWVFFKRDSYHEISVLHLKETMEGVKLDWLRTDFIGRKDGIHGPEGEFPYLSALADSVNKTIVLAYQNNRSEIMYASDGDGNFMNGSCTQGTTLRMEPYFFAKRSLVSIVRITADERKIFQDFPEYVERTQEFGLSLTHRLWVLYRRIDCETTNYEVLQRQGDVMLSYQNGEWSTPLILGRLDTSKDYYGASLFSSAHEPRFLMRLDDGLLHLLEAEPAP